MQSLLMIIGILAQFVFYLVMIQFLIGILASFDVINIRQPLVSQIYYGIGRLLDPLLNPIRRIMPDTGGMDFSPMVLLVGLYALQVVIANNI
jgi:YggT family protein